MLLGSLGVASPEAALVATLGWLLTQPPALLGGLFLLVPGPKSDAEARHASASTGVLAQVTSPGSLASRFS